MINELTAEQQAKIPEYVERGLRLGLGTERMDRADITNKINILYRAHGLEEVPVTFYDSPLAGSQAISASKKSSSKGLEPGYMWGCQELYWLYFYQFINNELPVNKTTCPLQETIDVCENVGWFWPFKDHCVVTEKPTELYWNNQRLHRSGGPAIRFADGFEVYSLNGIRFSKDLIKFVKDPIETLSAKEILSIKNVEQRAEAIKRFGIDRLFWDLSPAKLDSNDQYELYKISVYEGVPRIYLKMQNPSVDEVHIEAVHPDVKTITEALAWRNFGTLTSKGFRMPLVLT